MTAMMMRNRSLVLASAAAVLLIAGLWLSFHRSSQQADLGGGVLFADLSAALGNISEIRLSKGDGSRATLRRQSAGWTVVEREYPADAGRVRDLALSLARMKVIEHKTSDPANYPRLGVEAPDTPTAASTLVEVIAGDKTWALIVGKNAEGRAIYVRKPKEAASALAEPAVMVEPDPKRWVDRQLVDVAGAKVHDIAVKPANGPAYVLTRAKREDTDLVLSPVPKGRTAVSSMSLNSQADSLTALNFDDMRPSPAGVPGTDHATFRLFDGQVFEIAGRKEADKAYITITAHRDAALAAQFPELAAKAADKPGLPAPAGAPPATAAAPAGEAPAAPPAPAPPAAPAVPAHPASVALAADQTTERLAARATGLEFEIPLYKYESLFRHLEDMLEPKAPPAAKTPPKPAAGS